MLSRIPLGVAVASALAIGAQAAVGWPSGAVTSGNDPAPRHTAAAAPTPSATSTATPKPTPTEQPERPITFFDPEEGPPAALATFYGQSIAWRACKGSKRDLCGTVTVPVDYSDPDGATLRLALRKVPALTPAKRKGTLFINPGGPGISGVEFAKEAPDYFSKQVRRVWDVVGFDPRGIGQSESFECLRPRDLDAMYAADPTPETDAEKRAIERAARARLAGCIERGGDLAVNMSSEHVAMDLDIMRAVVGDTHLNYLGVSYGTLVGALYADLFASRVGLMVLDSAVPGDGFDDATVGQAEIDLWAAQAAADFDDVWAEYVAGCEDRDEGCPLGTEPKAAQAKVMKLLNRLETRPMRTGIRNLPRLTQGWASAALRAGLFYTESWADLDYALELALEDNDGQVLAYLAMMEAGREPDGTYAEATFGSNGLPVRCADWPVHDADRLVPSDSVLEANPLWAFVEAETHNRCDGWTGKARSTLIIFADAPTPILVIGNDGDLVTPMAGTAAFAETIARSRLVTVEADGHGAYAAGNRCADEIVDTYLVDAIAPKDGTECAEE